MKSREIGILQPDVRNKMLIVVSDVGLEIVTSKIRCSECMSNAIFWKKGRKNVRERIYQKIVTHSKTSFCFYRHD